MGNCLSATRDFFTKRNRYPDANPTIVATTATTLPSAHPHSSSTPQFTVFISHAGEDKATIAVPLRQKLREHGITAFVDEPDMPLGTEAPSAMINAMETARIAVIVLSPEFVARKWPMRELMCFLKRREECNANGRAPPIVIPFFYRLQIGELYDEPRLDRKDKDGNELYRKSRFYERQKSGEPEANIANIQEALRTLGTIMGLRNDVGASNDPSYLMSRRREILLRDLCEEIRKDVPAGTAEMTDERKIERTESDAFHPHFDVLYEIPELAFDFDSKGKNGKASSQEARLLRMVLDRSKGRNRSIGVRGIGGVGKTSLLRGIRSLKSVRHRFRDGMYSISLGMHARRIDLIGALSMAVQSSGGWRTAEAMRRETDVRKVIDLFRSWFTKKQCLFVIDDVWETTAIPSETVHEVLKLHESGRDSKVLLTTRSVEIASRAGTPFGLEPRSPLEYESRRILLHYSRIEPEQDQADDQRVFNEILERCCGLPLFLAVAGKAVRALSFRQGHEGCMAYHIYAQRLKESTETLLNAGTGSYEGLSARLTVSVKLLEERKTDFGIRVDLKITEMHRRLCVMRKQTRVPMTMLKHLWELESESQAADVAKEFEQVGLADVEFERRECGPIEVLRLHDSVYEFAATEAGKHDEEKVAHEALLRGYGRGLAISNGTREWWHTCIEADGYLHRNLCRHLHAAGRGAELVALLLSPQWAQRQVKISGILSLEADLSFGVEAIRDGMLYTSDQERFGTETALRLVSEAVTLSSTFIGNNVAELQFQVHGRLIGYRKSCKAIEKYVSWIETDGTKPSVLCEDSFLGEPGGMNTRIISVGPPVNCVAVMKKGELLACGSGRNGRIFVVDPEKGVVEKQWIAHDESVNAIVFSGDGRLVSGSRDKTVKVWDVDTGQCVRVFRGHSGWLGRFMYRKEGVNGLALMGDGKSVISVSLGGTAKVWELETGRTLSTLFTRHYGDTRCVAMLGDEEMAVTGGEDQKLRMWNLSTNEQVGDAFEGHESSVQSVAVTPDGKNIVSGSLDHTLRVWDVGSHQQIGDSLRGHGYLVNCVAVSGDGRRIVSGSLDNTIRVIDLESRRQICDPLEGHTDEVSGVSFLGDADRIVSSSYDGTIRIWDLAKQMTKEFANRRRERNENFFHLMEVQLNFVCGVSFTPDGNFVVSASSDKTLHIWNTVSRYEVGSPLEGHSGGVRDVAVTPNGKFILSASEDKTVRVWGFASRQLLHTFTGHTADVQCLAVTPQGDRAVTGSWDKTVRVWNLTAMDGSHVVLEGHNAAVHSVFVSDDGLRVISVDLRGNIFIWELQTKKLVKQVRRANARNLSRREVLNLVGEKIDHDDPVLSIPLFGRQIFYGEGADATVLATMETSISRWALSPDKKTICVGLYDGQVIFLKLLT